MINRKSLLLLIFFFFSAFPIISQELNYIHYTSNDGLPSSTVYRVLQDKKGFIWFATELGVSRFDGKKFTNYSSKDGLLDNTILEMYEDSKGKIWLLGLSGRVAYILNNKIHSGQNDTLLAKVHAKGWLTSIIEDKKGNIWIGSKFDQLFKISESKIETITASEYIISLGLIDDKIIFYCANGKMFIINPDYSIRDISAQPFFQSQNYENIGKVIFSENRMIFSTPNKIILSRLNDEKAEIIGEKNIGQANIQFLGIKNDFILAGTKRGAILLDKQLNIKQSFLQNQSISCIYYDREDNLWFTTSNDGVFFLPKSQISNFSDGFNNSELKVNDIIYSKKMKSIIIATDNGNIYTLKNKNGFIKDETHNGFPSLNRILDIAESDKGEIYGASDYGLFNKSNYGFISVNSSTPFPSDKKVIYSKRKGFFVGSYNHLRFTKDNKSAIIGTGRISSLFEDKNSNLWVGESRGLFFLSKFHLDSLIEKKYQSTIQIEKNIFENRIFMKWSEKDSIFLYKPNDIKQTNDGAVWVALQGKGIVRISVSGELSKFNTFSGLSSDICKIILPENDSVIWVGTNNGLNRLTFSAGTFLNPKVKIVTANSGITSDDINALEFQQDTLWIGTHNGVSFFKKSELFDNKISPPVYITNIKINATDTLVQQNFSLHYQQNSIEFDFVGLSYQVPNSVVFKYKLEGLDSQWKTTTSSYIQYNFLPPNSYKFYVLAKNNDGLWSASPDSLFFTIRPPFYNTWWFISSLLLLIAGMIFGFVQFRISQVKNKEEFKTRLNQAIVEGELKALRSQMNPHFIFNSMNSIKYFISKNDSESANKYLSKFSKLIRLILDNSRHHSISLAEELSALKLYLELESMRFGEKFSYEIKVSSEINSDITEIPSMMLQPFVENSIIHGIMPKSSSGSVIIEISKRNNQLFFVIEDDGVGRKKNEQNINFHQSVGISVTRQRLEIMTASLSSKSEIKITDKTDDKGNPIGTKVEIIIPVEND